MALLRGFDALRELRIQAPRLPTCTEWDPVEDIPLQSWLQTHVPRFGSS
jgi:hypothetical protein